MSTENEYKWLFEKPVKSDWAFMLWVGISMLAIVVTFVQNLVNGGIGAGSAIGVISGLIDGLFTVVGNFFIWYIISLLWLIPRRLIRK